MDASSVAALYIAWGSLLGAPVLAIATFTAFRKASPGKQFAIAAGSALTIIVISGVAAFGISFTESTVNFLCVAAAYFSYCYLVVSCWYIRIKAIRILAVLVLAIPIVIGYLLGTIGGLALGWIVMDFTAPPTHIERLKEGLICRVTPWGSAVSASGYTVRLYQQWDVLPFLERRLNSIEIDETSEQSERSSASCQDVFAAYSNASAID